jgi:hypothetical protein
VTQSYGSKTGFSNDRRAAEIVLKFLASLEIEKARYFYIGVTDKDTFRKISHENHIIFSKEK